MAELTGGKVSAPASGTVINLLDDSDSSDESDDSTFVGSPVAGGAPCPVVPRHCHGAGKPPRTGVDSCNGSQQQGEARQMEWSGSESDSEPSYDSSDDDADMVHYRKMMQRQRQKSRRQDTPAIATGPGTSSAVEAASAAAAHDSTTTASSTKPNVGDSEGTNYRSSPESTPAGESTSEAADRRATTAAATGSAGSNAEAYSLSDSTFSDSRQSGHDYVSKKRSRARNYSGMDIEEDSKAIRARRMNSNASGQRTEAAVSNVVMTAKKKVASVSNTQGDRKPEADRVGWEGSSRTCSSGEAGVSTASEGGEKGAAAQGRASKITWKVSDSTKVGSRVYAKFPQDGQWYWGNIIGHHWEEKSKRYKVLFEDGDTADSLTRAKICTEKWFVDRLECPPPPQPDRDLLRLRIAEASEEKKVKAPRSQSNKRKKDSAAPSFAQGGIVSTDGDVEGVANGGRVGLKATGLDDDDEGVVADDDSVVVVEDVEASEKDEPDGDPFTLSEFMEMWRIAEENALGLETEEFERKGMIKGSNHGKLRGDSQCGAQYGRLSFEATQEVFNLVGLTRDKVFLDIGHGIGNGVLHAAYTCGCESRGIEIDPDRNVFATIFEDSLRRQAADIFNNEASERLIATLRDEQLQQQQQQKEEEEGVVVPAAPTPADPLQRNDPGRVRLVEGNLRAPEHRYFLTTCDVILVNNAEGIFAARNEDKAALSSLDAHIAYLFAISRPGTVMVTLHPLTMLGQSLSVANSVRKQRGLPEHENASFFEYRRETLGVSRRKGLSWAGERATTDDKRADDFVVHIYTRTEQSSCTPLFLCCNHKCQGSATPTVAYQIDTDNSEQLADECYYCRKKRVVTRPHRKKPSRFGYED